MQTNTLERIVPVGGQLLTESELKHGETLVLKFPKLATMAKEVLEVATGFATKSVSLIRELRVSGLNRREAGLLLMALGYTKQRVSYLWKVVEVSEVDFVELETGARSVDAMVRIQRQRKPGRGGRKKRTSLRERAESAIKFKTFSGGAPDSIKAKVLAAVVELGPLIAQMTEGKPEGPYGFTYTAASGCKVFITAVVTVAKPARKKRK